VKDLEKPWTFCTEKQHHHSAATTLLLDDSPLKAHLQPFNHLCVPEYDSKLRADDLARLKYDMAKLEEEKKSNVISVAPDGITEITSSDVGAPTGIVPPDDALAAVVANADADDRAQSTSEQMKKSKKKKKKAKASLEEPSHTYDQTLLAVIGILDTIHTQSNVAGWIRSRGLWAGEQPDTKGIREILSINRLFR
jgi:F0F1-type ATP synthase epsilon subunit